VATNSEYRHRWFGKGKCEAEIAQSRSPEIRRVSIHVTVFDPHCGTDISYSFFSQGIQVAHPRLRARVHAFVRCVQKEQVPSGKSKLPDESESLVPKDLVGDVVSLP
jgi:hypothetical protein